MTWQRHIRVLATSAALLCSLLGAGCAIDLSAGEFSTIEKKSYTVAAGVTPTIALTTFDGRVEVRGWDALAKRGLVAAGSTVRVTGANAQGKKLEYRGHVTVLK